MIECYKYSAPLALRCEDIDSNDLLFAHSSCIYKQPNPRYATGLPQFTTGAGQGAQRLVRRCSRSWLSEVLIPPNDGRQPTRLEEFAEGFTGEILRNQIAILEPPVVRRTKQKIYTSLT
jgi:hypothetical protein